MKRQQQIETTALVAAAASALGLAVSTYRGEAYLAGFFGVFFGWISLAWAALASSRTGWPFP